MHAVDRERRRGGASRSRARCPGERLRPVAMIARGEADLVADARRDHAGGRPTPARRGAGRHRGRRRVMAAAAEPLREPERTPGGRPARPLATRHQPQARRIASAMPTALLELIGRVPAHVRGRTRHRERAPGDLEHRHVVDPVSDDDRVGDRAARGGAELGERGALQSARRRARAPRTCRESSRPRSSPRRSRATARPPSAASTVSRSPIATAASGSVSHALACSTTRQVRRPRADVVRVRRARVLVVDAVLVEDERREPGERVAQRTLTDAGAIA